MRKAAAGLILAASGAVAGAAFRLARPGDAEALAAAASAVAPDGVVGLVVVTDPGCPACGAALEGLRDVVRPEELGVSVRILENDRAGLALLEASGPGLLPLLVVTDASGQPVAMLRGARPPHLMRAWLEDATSRALAMPLDRHAARGPP